MKKRFLTYIHPDDKELIDFLTEKGCEIRVSGGSDYYHARVEKEKIDEIVKELRDKLGIDLDPDSTFDPRERYKEFKEKELKRLFKDKKVVVLRSSTLQDRITYGLRLGSVEELFDIFPNLEVIIDKAEDRWEGGSDIWAIYTKDDEEIEEISVYGWKSVEDFLIEKGLMDEKIIFGPEC